MSQATWATYPTVRRYLIKPFQPTRKPGAPSETPPTNNAPPPPPWTCVSAMSFSPRVMVVHLRNADGLEISVVGAHFRHEPSKRLAQYELLRKQSKYINLGRHCVLLADHNSVMAPGVDSEVCTVHDGLLDAVSARDAELAFCVSHDLCDAWSHAFKPTEGPDADHTPKGWT